MSQYVGYFAVAGVSVAFEWRESKWGSDGWGSTASFTFVAALLGVLVVAGLQYVVMRWVPRGPAVGVVLVAATAGAGLGLLTLLVGRPPAAVFFLVPLVGGAIEVAMARFERVRA